MHGELQHPGVHSPAIEPPGRVLAVRGSQASVGLPEIGPDGPADARATVGKFLGMLCGDSLVIGVITDVSMQTLPIAREQGYKVTAQLDLMGEIKEDGTGAAHFLRGVTRELVRLGHR